MPGRSYIQEAAGAMRQASAALKADAAQIRRQGSSEASQYHAQADSAERKRNTAAVALAALQAGEEMRADVLRKEALEGERESKEAQAKAKEAESVAAQRASQAESAASQAESIAGAIDRLLGQSGYE